MTMCQMCNDMSYSESARTPCCAYCISDSTCSNSLRSCCTWRLRAATSCRRTSGSCREHMLDATEFTVQCPHNYNHPSISQLCQSITAADLNATINRSWKSQNQYYSCKSMSQKPIDHRRQSVSQFHSQSVSQRPINVLAAN